MEAMLYEPFAEGAVQCNLCSHRCRIPAGKRGICGVRENSQGRLMTLVYGRLIARHADPIEKKPLFHFLPGSYSYSIATVGCNFRCRFCQNADIAQMPAEHGGAILGESATPESVVSEALRLECETIAYTYTEPTVFLEFALDVMKSARKAGIRNVFVTNGYMTEEALEQAAPFLDAANVDLKSFRPEFYRDVCGGRLKPVMETLIRMVKKGIWVEVTTLLIPGLNDQPEELRDLARFLSEDLGPDIPWHISRFHPDYRMTDRPPTPVATLNAARRIGLSAGLRYVYTGNVPGEEGGDTFCPSCNALVVKRWGFEVRENRIREGRCPACRARIAGVLEKIGPEKESES